MMKGVEKFVYIYYSGHVALNLVNSSIFCTVLLNICVLGWNLTSAHPFCV